jgi:hypothetical protein
MSDESSEAGQNGRVGAPLKANECSCSALEEIGCEGERSEAFSSGSQYICSADISRPDVAYIASTRCPWDQQSEWN